MKTYNHRKMNKITLKPIETMQSLQDNVNKNP